MTESLAARWNAVFVRPDPWSYEDLYERTKRSHTLALLSDRHYTRALEVGCAEGHLSCELAGRAVSVHGIDIAPRALERARHRCLGLANLTFEQCDAFRRLPPGPFELIVCSEVLYYARNRFALDRMARRLARLLSDGGDLVLTHSHCVSDCRRETGFDFHEFGAAFIQHCVAGRHRLRLVREIRTELYRAQLYRKLSASAARELPATEVAFAPFAMAPGDRAAALVKWGGCDVTDAEARHLWVSPEITVLLYHRVADEGPVGLAPYRVSPSAFARQVSHLHRNGYRSLSIEDAWGLLHGARQPPAGRFVVFTFDDAYADFAETAWPILRAHGYSATVFVPVSHVGGRAEWDCAHGEAAGLMTWQQIRGIHGQGASVASHGMSHRRLADLEPAESRRELVASREILQQEIGDAPMLFAYPWGSVDARVRRQAEEAGYRFAVAGSGFLRAGADPFVLPRQEVLGHHSLAAFTGLLTGGVGAALRSRLAYRWRRLLRDRRTYTDW